jgi:hypothetical protein
MSDNKGNLKLFAITHGAKSYKFFLLKSPFPKIDRKIFVKHFREFQPFCKKTDCKKFVRSYVNDNLKASIIKLFSQPQFILQGIKLGRLTLLVTSTLV